MRMPQTSQRVSSRGYLYDCSSSYITGDRNWPVSLQLIVPVTGVGIGEPVKVTVQWQANQAVEILNCENSEFARGTLSFRVNDGKTTRQYFEFRHSWADEVYRAGSAPAGFVFTENYVLATGGYGGKREDAKA